MFKKKAYRKLSSDVRKCRKTFPFLLITSLDLSEDFRKLWFLSRCNFHRQFCERLAAAQLKLGERNKCTLTAICLLQHSFLLKILEHQNKQQERRITNRDFFRSQLHSLWKTTRAIFSAFICFSVFNERALSKALQLSPADKIPRAVGKQSHMEGWN